ncbi:MAG: hypothetical protein HY326_14600 [Chloroflexi bacterium]|nr:hypothetical protein [Chloroflexota bacterium]
MLTTVQVTLRRLVNPFSAAQYNVIAHERLRLYTLITIAVLKVFNFLGGNWDIQWHVAIGRDSLWIPPHLMVMVAFVSGTILVLAAIAYELYLTKSQIKLQNVVKIGTVRAPLAFFGVYLGYAGALGSAIFDDVWHRAYGVDATLWSPPHLAIMAFTALVDVSLLIGIAASARHLQMKFNWRTPAFWGIILAGAYTFEAVNFQMGQAFLVGYRAHGAGLMGLLFPVMVGVLFPLSLMLNIKLSRTFWVATLIFITAVILEAIAIGFATLGFALLKPVSAIEEFVRDNPDSMIATARQFGTLTGFTSLIGYQQLWIMALSGISMGLVSLLHWWPWARRHMLVAAPVYSGSMVLVSYFWFQRMPVMKDYGTTWVDIAVGMAIAIAGGLIAGRIGLWLARISEEN